VQDPVRRVRFPLPSDRRLCDPGKHAGSKIAGCHIMILKNRRKPNPKINSVHYSFRYVVASEAKQSPVFKRFLVVSAGRLLRRKCAVSQRHQIRDLLKFIPVTGGTASMNVAKWRKSVTISYWCEIVE
jgi:hypothetical protein